MQDYKYDSYVNIIISLIMVGSFFLLYFLNDLKDYIKTNELKSNLKSNYSLVATSDNFSKKYITLNGIPNKECTLSIDMDRNKVIDLLNDLNHHALIIQYENKLYVSNYAKDKVDKTTIMSYINNCINESENTHILEQKIKDMNLLSWNNINSSIKN